MFNFIFGPFQIRQWFVNIVVSDLCLFSKPVLDLHMLYNVKELCNMDLSVSVGLSILVLFYFARESFLRNHRVHGSYSNIAGALSVWGGFM